jgi:hypothetical protein
MPAGLDLRRTLRGHLERHQEPPAGGARDMTARILSRRNRSAGSQQPPSQARGGGPPEHPRPTATTQAATARSDSVQHLSAVHQRVFRLQQAGQAVELLEPRKWRIVSPSRWNPFSIGR